MLRKATGLALYILVWAIIARAQTVERSFTVPASPYQVFNAMTVEWQIRQWTGAMGVLSDPQPGGAWRISYDDEGVDEGLYGAVERGSRLEFTVIRDNEPTSVVITMRASGTGTEVGITHQIATTGRSGQRLQKSLEKWWDERLERLTSYLTQLPGGYAAKPAGNGPFSAILVLHDRFGLNRTIRGYCDSLATRGYLAVAADMFRGEVTSDATQAARYVELVSADDALSSARQALQYLRGRDDTQSNRTAVWGIGFGGGTGLSLATTDAKLRACIAWHPQRLPETVQLSRIAAAVQVIFADVNPTNPRAEISAFVQALVQAGVRNDNRVLSGPSDFSDSAYGEGYNAVAISDAWRMMFIFLDKQLRP